jgi:hypothetical protein
MEFFVLCGMPARGVSCLMQRFASEEFVCFLREQGERINAASQEVTTSGLELHRRRKNKIIMWQISYVARIVVKFSVPPICSYVVVVSMVFDSTS